MERIIKNWKLIKEPGVKFNMKIENLKTGFCDYPLMYQDGWIVYDRPENVPAYVKKAVKQLFAQ